MSVAFDRHSKRRPRPFIWGVAFVAGLSAVLLFAYNPLQDNVNGPVPARWPGSTVTWSFNPKLGTNLDTQDSAQVATAVTTAFNVWPTTPLGGTTLNALSVVRGSDAPMALTDPDTNDCLNVISFSASDQVKFPTGTIAFTDIVSAFGTPPFSYTCKNPDGTTTQKTSTLPSAIKDADIVFNPAQSFSTALVAPVGRFDVQSVASHEFGHVLGLDHSGIAHVMMYPFGDKGAGEQRDLGVDDEVGVAFLYPAASFSSSTGTISGRVTLSASGIFASHVVAVDATSGAAVIDGLTNPDGTYKLVGVPPGKYQLLAQPLTGVYTVNDFSGWTCGYNENAPPCCDPKTDTTCTGTAQSPSTNYTGKFF